MFMPSCPECSHPIPVNGDRPPWCPRCGADFKSRRSPDRPAPTGPADARSESPACDSRPVLLSPTPPDGALPFLSACKLTLLSKDRENFRIYITGTDLLVLKLGPPPFRERRVMAQVIGGALGGATGRLLRGALLGDQRQAEPRDRERLLDVADEVTLRQYADEWKGSFAADPKDVSRLRIGSTSWWRRFLSGIEHEGMLTLQHRWEGKVTLALPSLTDVRCAVEELPRLFGEVVEINLPWGPGRGPVA
jgi:hypothetical protein